MAGERAGKLGWGILSTARINRRVIPALRASSRSRLVGVASRELVKARQFARFWGIPFSWGSYQELLEEPTIAAVYIPLPNHLHCTWVKRALEAGKHVLCEKPLGLSPQEVDSMARAASEAGTVLMEGFQFRFHPQISAVEKALQDFELGSLLLVRGSFSFVAADEGNIRLRRETGGGCLWDIGCYPVCLMQALLGRGPSEVFAWQIQGPTGVDVFMAGQVRYRSGAVGQFDCSFETPYRVGAEVVCRRGRIVLPEAWRAGLSGRSAIQVYTADEDHSIEIPKANPFQCELEAMERAALDGEKPEYSMEDSRDLVRTLTALYRSAQSGEPVVPDEIAGPESNEIIDSKYGRIP